MRKKPFVIAHRGMSCYAPENTLAALIKAHELGFKWVEFDVMLAGCGEAIIMHDTRVDRTTNGKGDVINFSYPELLKLSAGKWFSKEFENERIPTFKQFIEFLQTKHMHAVIEVKPFPGFEVATATKVIEMLKQFWPDFYASTVLSSFAKPCLETIRNLDPKANLAMALHDWANGWEEQAAHLSCQSIHVNQRILHSVRDVDKVKSLGYELYSYTVNDNEKAQKLFSLGVDAVFSDFPDRIIIGSP